MTLDPKEYDFDQLRKQTGAGKEPSKNIEKEVDEPDIGWGKEVPSARNGTFRNELYRELAPYEKASPDLEKPYLVELPDKPSAEHLVFEWLEYLLSAAGFKGATQALSYYEAIDWITTDAESSLGTYLVGMDERPGEFDNLDVDDHLASLLYVAKLVSMAE
jgi:flagellar protein FlaE